VHGKHIGISNTFSGLAEFREAALNAQWALGTIRDAGRGVVHYDSAEFSVLPRSEGDANEIVRRVLGPLMNQKNGGTAHLDTLCAYLDNERNWAATATALGVHKQTLAYRLQRIEKLTGRSLKSTRDIAELWIARSALKRR
jgi:purine catabolism regulator